MAIITQNIGAANLLQISYLHHLAFSHIDPGTVDQLSDVDVHGGILVISVRRLYLTERRLEKVVWQHISDTV